MIHPTSEQIDAAFVALRHFVDQAGYGRFVNDDWINRAATAATTAVVNVPPAALSVADAPAAKSVIYRKGKKK